MEWWLGLGVLFLSCIPAIDQRVSHFISARVQTRDFMTHFSNYIIYFNIGVNLYLLYLLYLLYSSVHMAHLLCRYFIELFLVNLIFKLGIYRPRPIEGLYVPIYQLRWWKYDIWKNQSFPSGHVTTMFTTYYLLPDTDKLAKLYLVLIGITIYARMNVGAHYFSDCMFAIFIAICVFKLFGI
jgi:membrane-associated phospholipid phosphatase